MPSLGELIKQYREQRGWSLGDLALAADVSRPWVSRVESDSIKRPDADTLRRVARALRIRPDVLLAAAGYEVNEISPEDRPLSEQLEEILQKVREMEARQGSSFRPTQTKEVEGIPPLKARNRTRASAPVIMGRIRQQRKPKARPTERGDSASVRALAPARERELVSV